MPSPTNVPLSSGIWFQRKFGMLGKQVIAEDPVCVEKIVFRKIDAIRVFNDAANLHIRQRKSLCQIFHALGFDDGFVEYLSVKICDGTIRTNRPRLDAANIC